MNKKIAEANINLDEENLAKVKEETAEKTNEAKNKKKKITAAQLNDRSAFIAKKLNFIASTVVNWAIEKGIGAIYIPNVNRHNNRLIAIIKSLVNNQPHTPLYVYTLFDEFNTMDLIRTMTCMNVTNLDKILVNSDRNSISLGIDEKGKTCLKFNSESHYNYEISCAYMKCGLDNPFESFYIGNHKIDNRLLNAGIISDKPMTNEMKTAFLNKVHTVTKNAINYQKKLQCF